MSMAVCTGLCGVTKVAVFSVAAFALAAGGVTLFADDKPTETKPSESKSSETKPSEAKPSETKAEGDETKVDKPAEAKVDPFVLDHTMKDIDGADQDLAQYKGKVVLFVNVASKCGFTTQYTGLQKLWERKKDAGLVIVGIPANDFGRQEPGSDSEIKEFCSSKYSVTFPMMSKVSVKGAEMCELYKDLTSQPSPIGGAVSWNFTKFLVDRAGNVVGRYESRVRPDDVELNRKIDELLAAAKPAEAAPAATEKSEEAAKPKGE
jgi:glutathione peroxidase